ncbi:MAG: hypothetical protein AAF989_00485 [Planctomycetota bacterium]
MNFLCHAIPYMQSPWSAAATAVPDWLSVVDRKIRARSRFAIPHLDSDDPTLAAVAKGIVAHHDDDRWFHGGEAFVQTNLEFAVQLRDLLQKVDGEKEAGFRPTFVGHILIEMLLDKFWLEDHPHLGRDYYKMLGEISPEEIERCVNIITGKPTDMLAPTIRRFHETKFLLDYLDDQKLLRRLNQVMNRVGLAVLPDALLDWFPDAQEQVRRKRDMMLTPPGASSPFPLES